MCIRDSYFTDLFLENGNINVTLGKESKVSGTPNNDAYQKFKDEMCIRDRSWA